MAFTFTINGHTYTSDPNNVAVPEGYRFVKYGYITALANLAQDIAVVTGLMSASAVGGAISIQYKFSTTTADADPGSGFLRLGNATQNASTVMRVDLADSNGTDWTSQLDTFDASTSTVKGEIRLVKKSDGSKFLTFNVTAKASPAGYRNFTVTNTGGSSASPFADGDDIYLLFSRKGDKGDTGAAGAPGSSPTAAIQTEMEAASDNTKMVTPANANWHPGVAKAWIKCNYAGAVQASHNITSITDSGTGQVTITIGTDFSSADYAVVCTNLNWDARLSHVRTQNAGSLLILTSTFNYTNPPPADADATNLFVVCYGDQ